MKPEEFELKVEKSELDSANVPIRWCVDQEMLAKLQVAGATKPHVLIIVTPKGKKWAARRHLYDMDEVMGHVNMYHPGENLIQAVLVWSEDARYRDLKKEFLNRDSSGYTTDVIDILMDGDVLNAKVEAQMVEYRKRDNYAVELEQSWAQDTRNHIVNTSQEDDNPDEWLTEVVFGQSSRGSDTKCDCIPEIATLTLDIPAELFASKPNAALWAIAHIWTDGPTRDQCHYRQRLWSSVLAKMWLFGIFKGLEIIFFYLFATFLFIIGRKIDWSVLGSPLLTDLNDVPTYKRGESKFAYWKDEFTKGPLWYSGLFPAPTLAIAAVSWLVTKGPWYETIPQGLGLGLMVTCAVMYGVPLVVLLVVLAFKFVFMSLMKVTVFPLFKHIINPIYFTLFHPFVKFFGKHVDKIHDFGDFISAIFYCIFFPIIYPIDLLNGWMDKKAVAKAKQLNSDLLQNEDYHLICRPNMPAKVSDIPWKKRKAKLVFTSIKHKVCKPLPGAM